MLCPHGPNFLVRGKLAAFGLCNRSVEVGFFLWRELIRLLLVPRELQEHARGFILHVVGQGGHCGDSLFKQAGHGGDYSAVFASARCPRGGGALEAADFERLAVERRVGAIFLAQVGLGFLLKLGAVRG